MIAITLIIIYLVSVLGAKLEITRLFTHTFKYITPGIIGVVYTFCPGINTGFTVIYLIHSLYLLLPEDFDEKFFKIPKR